MPVIWAADRGVTFGTFGVSSELGGATEPEIRVNEGHVL